MSKVKTAPSIWSDAERRAWQLPREIKVSEWADEFLFLDPRNSAEPGQWMTSRTPYLKEIMDSFSDPDVEEIALMMSTQVGKTQCMLNMLAYAVDQDPAPALWVMPREPDAKSISKDRIVPLLEGSDQLISHLTTNSDDLTKLELRLDRMVIYMAGANSPAALAQKPIRYLFIDECNKYPKFSGREADPIKLATERTRTFWNRKIVKCSTPTTRDGYITREYERSDRRKFNVPCPKCGEYQPFVFQGIRWDENQRDPEIIKEKRLAWYECAVCKEKITDIHKTRMLNQGVWAPDGVAVEKSGKLMGEAPRTSRRGYWLNAIYSPWLTFSEIAAEFLECKGKPEVLMNFVNSWLAEIWEEKTEETSEDKIKKLQIEYPMGQVPEKVFVITAAVDVQKDYFLMSIRGWAPGEESFLIRAARIESWDELDIALFKTSYAKRNAEPFNVRLALIDSGYRTDEVYAFCRRHRDRARAIKGEETLSGVPYKVTKIERNPRTGMLMEGGLTLWRLDTTLFKDKLARLISATEEDPAKFYIYAGAPDEYIRQMASEQKVIERDRRRGTVREVWKKKGNAVANHYWDCEVYNLAAADMLHVAAMGARPGTTNVFRARSPGSSSALREDSGRWLGERKNWMRRT